MPEGPATILMRQVYNDWDVEKPAMLSIERVDATYPPPALSADNLG